MGSFSDTSSLQSAWKPVHAFTQTLFTPSHAFRRYSRGFQWSVGISRPRSSRRRDEDSLCSDENYNSVSKAECVYNAFPPPIICPDGCSVPSVLSPTRFSIKRCIAATFKLIRFPKGHAHTTNNTFHNSHGFRTNFFRCWRDRKISPIFFHSRLHRVFSL